MFRVVLLFRVVLFSWQVGPIIGMKHLSISLVLLLALRSDLSIIKI